MVQVNREEEICGVPQHKVAQARVMVLLHMEGVEVMMVQGLGQPLLAKLTHPMTPNSQETPLEAVIALLEVEEALLVVQSRPQWGPTRRHKKTNLSLLLFTTQVGV